MFSAARSTLVTGFCMKVIPLLVPAFRCQEFTASGEKEQRSHGQSRQENSDPFPQMQRAEEQANTRHSSSLKSTALSVKKSRKQRFA
jgi:hypothetical protein